MFKKIRTKKLGLLARGISLNLFSKRRIIMVAFFLSCFAPLASIAASEQTVSTCGQNGSPMWVKDTRLANVSLVNAGGSLNMRYGAQVLSLGELDDTGQRPVLIQGWFDNFFGHPVSANKKHLTIGNMGGEIYPSKEDKNTIIGKAGAGARLALTGKAKGALLEFCVTGHIANDSLSNKREVLPTYKTEALPKGTTDTLCHVQGQKGWVVPEQKNGHLNPANLMSLDHKKLLNDIALGTEVVIVDEQKTPNVLHVVMSGWSSLDFASTALTGDVARLGGITSKLISDPSQAFSKKKAGLADSEYSYIGHYIKDGKQAFQLCVEGTIPKKNILLSEEDLAQKFQEYEQEKYLAHLARFAPVQGMASQLGQSDIHFVRLAYQEQSSKNVGDKLIVGIATMGLSFVADMFNESEMQHGFILKTDQGIQRKVTFKDIFELKFSGSACEKWPACLEARLKDGTTLKGRFVPQQGKSATIRAMDDKGKEYSIVPSRLQNEVALTFR